MLLALSMVTILAPDRAPGNPPDCAFEAYQAAMAAAEKSLRLEETRELRRWLDACAAELRGWEWEHLHAIADTSVRHVKMQETPVRIVMSPTGNQVATVEGAQVRILSWPQLEESAVIEGHGDAIYRAEFSSDGSRMITVSRDVTSRAWDTASGAEIARIQLANPAFAAACFDPTGTSAATCAWERDESGHVHGVVWVWDAATGEVAHRKRVGIKPLSSIRFTPDGSNIIVGSWDGLVHMLDPEANEVRRLSLPDEGIYNAVNDIAISPDGRLLAAASKDRTTRVFALERGDLVATLRGHGGYVEGVSFSPDGAMLATCSVDATVALWNVEGWKRRKVLRGAADAVRGVAWAAEGRSILGSSFDGRLWVWDAYADHDATCNIQTGHDGIYSGAFDPGGGAIAVACYDGWIRIFDSRSGALQREWEAHPGSTCHAATFSEDGRRLITCSWDKTARVWDPNDGREIASLEAQAGVYAADISPDGVSAATSGKTLQIWDVDRSERLHDIAVEDAEPTRLEFSSDGRLIASGWTDGFARIHDTSDGALLTALGTGEGRVETVAFLAGDSRVATGDAAGVVRVFPVRGGDAIFATDTGGRAINHVACSADRIAVATDQLWLIDAERGGIVLGLAPHADSIWHLSWSADGERLATCAIAGTIRILQRQRPFPRE